ncbi:glycosyltransferase [Paenibacillus sp. strain BS8-2]
MEILHINTNDLRGGAAKVMDRLIVAQNNLGHSSKAIVNNKEISSNYTFPFDNGIDIDGKQYVDSKGMLDYEYNGVFNLINNPLFRKADIIHLHNMHGYYFNPYAISVLSHFKPIIWTLHDMQSVTGHCSYAFDCNSWQFGCGNCSNLKEYPAIKSDRTALNWREKKDIYNKSKLFIVPVAKWIENIARKGILMSQPMETILNGVDIAVYRPLSKEMLKKKYGIPTDKIIIGTVANGGAFSQERKGGKYVQAVMERLIKEGHEVLLVSVGGERKGFINDNLFDVGYISSEQEMAEVYNTFDIYMFPSLADTCPLVISEAMACGIPIVTFNTGGIPELVEHEITGYIASKHDLEQLYEYTLRLVMDQQLRGKFAENSRKFCLKYFDHNIIVEQYNKVYGKAISYYEKNKDKILYFNQMDVPSFVWGSKEFQHAEIIKDKLLPKLDIPNQKLIIVSSKINELTEEVSFEEAVNLQVSDTDIVFIERSGYEVESKFFEIMLYKGVNTDILASTVLLQKDNGTKFFSSISSVQDRGQKLVNTSIGGLFYKGDFFKKNRECILHGGMTEYSTKEQFIVDMVKVKVDGFLHQLVQQDIYIYGAGLHTKELLTQCPTLHMFVKGIIDSNSSMWGKLFMNNFSILSIDEANTETPILISSATFEREIFSQLKEKVNNRLITIYNN